MRHSIRVEDLNDAVGRDRAEQRADDAFGLVRASHVVVAYVEDDQRVNLGGQGRRGRSELQHCLLAWRHSLR